jgi:hypothetical protein
VLVRTSKIYSDYIVLQRVYTNSIETVPSEEEAEPDPKIWLLGQAGWYAITPAPEYEKLFKQGMVKAKMWTFLEDTYLEQFDSGGPISGTCHTLAKDYVDDPRSGECSNIMSAMTLFSKVRRPLLSRMLENEELREQWIRTPLFQLYNDNYGKDIREIKEILRKQRRLQESQTSSPPASPERDSTGSLDTPRGTPAHSQKPHAKSWSRTIFKWLENYVCTHPNIKAGDVTFSKLAEILNEHFETNGLVEANDILAVRASELVVLMDGSIRYAWKHRQAFEELKKAAATAIDERKRSSIWTLKPSTRPTILNIKSTESLVVPAQSRFGAKDESGARVLRETGSETKAGHQSEPCVTPENEDRNSQLPALTMSQRLNNQPMSAAVNKRIGVSGSSGKRRRTTNDTVAQDAAAHRDAPSRWPPLHMGRGRPPLDVRPMLDTTTFVDDVWSCPLRSCTFKTLPSERAEATSRITAHYREHEDQLVAMGILPSSVVHNPKLENVFPLSFLSE